MTALSDWLHALPAEHILALRQFRAAALVAHPTERNAMAAALDKGEAPTLIAQMPRDFVVALNR